MTVTRIGIIGAMDEEISEFLSHVEVTKTVEWKIFRIHEANLFGVPVVVMKCGVGKCGHCCIGVAYVCVDGPVFTCEQIKKLGEDI